MPKRVSPNEAKALLDEGYAYIDVRTPEEFAGGHPEGAYNVPIGDQLVTSMERLWGGDKSARVVIGCLAGGRSLRAAMALEAAGWTNVVDQRAGWGGAGGEAGWAASGLPVSAQPLPGRSWNEIAAKR